MLYLKAYFVSNKLFFLLVTTLFLSHNTLSANRKQVKIMLERGDLDISSQIHRHFKLSKPKTKRFISISQQLQALQFHRKVPPSCQHSIEIFLILFVLKYNCQVLHMLILKTFWQPSFLSILRTPDPDWEKLHRSEGPSSAIDKL